ncbi:MAG TPA: DUF6600 domain-containing protein [Rhodanobacteraceae bacterium]|jgi:hypothetical protein|nr:DUF6600 domain-containing protein [Rhodanobacteraceae bacterium]
MYFKQSLLVLLIGAALGCSGGVQAPAEPGANQAPGASTSEAPGPNQVPDASAAAAPAQVDPPARVARLANTSGNVSFAPAGETNWVQAQVNRPVVTGDKLWTDDASRAELQLGASTIRLDYRSNFDFLNLNDQIAQMELTQGTLNLDVWHLNGNETYEVDTPTIAFIANRVGDYRIDVDPQGGFTTVTVRRGAGEAVGEGGKRVAIAEDQSIRFNDSALKDYRVIASSTDDFDLYCTQRNERHARAPARSYVSENVVGHEDLEEYGAWENEPQYGHVWYPAGVAVDWAPYHAGHWIWVDPWGWTWVDDAPWGFAPFHYGRWAYVGTRWGWVPGPAFIPPVYAPALVAFVGGGGFSISASFGGPIGWFALGPGDLYFPGYYGGHDYFNRVNASNTYVNQTVVNNYYGAWSSGNVNYSQMTFANRNAPRALTAMPTAAFAAGQPVATSAVAANRTTLANARVLPRAMVAPTRASLVAGSGSATATPPAAAVNRSVVAARAPAVQPSFAQRQALLQNSAGQPLSMNQMRSLATQPNNARGGTAGTTAASGNVRVVGDRITAQASATTAAGTQNSAQGESTAQAARGQVSNGHTLPNSGAKQPDATIGQQGHVRSATFAHPTSSGPGANASGRDAAIAQQQQPAATPAHAGGPNGVHGIGEQTHSTAAATQRGNRNATQTGNNTALSMQRSAQSASHSSGAGATASRSPVGNRQHSPAPAHYAEQHVATQRSAPHPYAPEQRSARAPHGAPQQRMPMERIPPQALAQHAPIPQQRGPGPQRQTSMAHSAPQHAAHGNKKDGGG